MMGGGKEMPLGYNKASKFFARRDVERILLAHDMVGYPIFVHDVVFDGERPWRAESLNEDGTLHAVDAHAWEIVAGPLDPQQVVRVRSERIDNYEYMQSVWRQCQIIKEFMES